MQGWAAHVCEGDAAASSSRAVSVPVTGPCAAAAQAQTYARPAALTAATWRDTRGQRSGQQLPCFYAPRPAMHLAHCARCARLGVGLRRMGTRALPRSTLRCSGDAVCMPCR